MKKLIRIALLICILAVQGHLMASTVIVKGTVKDSANNPIYGRTVRIYSVDSTNGGCVISHSVSTNPNGYYADTLSCNGDIRRLLIIVENCNGSKITKDVTVGTSNVVEANFIICRPNTTPISCKAAFSYTSLATGVKFNSAGSVTVSGDSIISRSWNFGDSTPVLNSNQVDPTHSYAKAGIYTVCLTIKTKSGCQSSYCQTVVFTPASNDCKAQAVFSFEKLAPKKLRFNSSQSSTLAGDSIFQRIWKFGDGSSLDGNYINPIKEYKDTGVYNVCLTVKTVKGCEKQYCMSVVIKDSITITPAPCKAQFSSAAQGLTVKFNSNNSFVPAGDSIVSRYWLFGDNTLPIDGNRVDPSHQYRAAGTYTVCLYIKTKNGCESKSCTEILVKDTITTTPPAGCKAYFTYQIKDSIIYFSSAASKAASDSDKIISRTWYYTDSSISVSLGGNVIDTFYKFAKPGTYNVTLVIKTKAGCESRFTAPVVIKAPLPATGCKAIFGYSIQNGTVKFNSRESRGTNEKDSILSRVWIFGDSTVPMQGNIIDPTHVYTKSGKYTVMLYIKTQSGCESKYSLVVTVGTVNCPVKVQFTAERISLKKIQFNSSLSTAEAGDSIIQRNWKFGDNTILSGNEIKPVKEFSLLGIYNTCLQVRTLNGCEAQECKKVIVQDTLNAAQAPGDYVKIININPNPVVTRMIANIFSRNSDTEAEITVYDIYGMPKLTVKRSLSQGNNMVEINCESLYHGPYFLKVSTRKGKDSKAFYKL